MTEEALWAEYGRHIRLSALIKDEIERKTNLKGRVTAKGRCRDNNQSFKGYHPEK